MHLGNDRFCPVVPVCIHRSDFFVAPEQNIVHTPGVDGHRCDIRKCFLRLGNAGLHEAHQSVNIPDQVSILFGDTVGKAVYFFCADCAVIQPAHNMPSGGCADVNGKRIVHIYHPKLFNHKNSKKCRTAFA